MQETWVPSLGREDSWREHGNPLQYSCLENSMDKRSLAGYSLWGHKESNRTELLTQTNTHTHTHTHTHSYTHTLTHTHTYGGNAPSLVAQTRENPPAMQETGFDPWVEKIPWSREWQPTPVFLPGEFHGQGSLAEGYSPGA